jgi:hypothetical protein
MREASRWRTASVVAAALGLLGLVTGLAFGAKVTTKSATVTLPNDQLTHSATAQCKQRAKAVAGGHQLSDDVQDYVAGSYPTGKRGWTAGGLRPTSQIGDEELTTFVRCLKGAKVRTKNATATLPDDAAASLTVKCPKGSKVSGGGVAVSPDDPYNIAEPAGSYPSGKREWTAVGEAYDPNVELTAFAKCLKGAKITRRSESLDMPDDGDTHRVTATCPKKTKAVGGGIELSEPYDDYDQGSYPSGKRGWTAAGYDSGIVTAHVLCLKRPKKK